MFFGYGRSIGKPSAVTLMWAACAGNCQVVLDLVAASASVNALEYDPILRLKVSPLHMAMSFSGRFPVIEALLDAKADAHVLSATGNSVLQHAVAFAPAYMILAWLKLFPNSNLEACSSFAGHTLLHTAALRSADQAMMRVLLDARSNVGATSRFGLQPLALAAQNPFSRAEAVKQLVKAHADVNHPAPALWSFAASLDAGSTALHFAVRSVNEEVIRALLDAGADVSKPNRQGLIALELAPASLQPVLARASDGLRLRE